MEEDDHLANERNKSQFDVEAMKIVWAGSRYAFEVADRMARLVESDPIFCKDSRAMLSRKELFRNTLKKAAHAWNLVVELHLSVDGYWGVPKLRGDASCSWLGHLPNCPCQSSSAPGGSGGDRSGSSRRTD
ncbi:peroxisomal acyl-coenzyme A oxidase 1 [Cinnamomum micranthum f. kanehirae]|uniref:Peroxisomal acyl-coenzyme A oxidase 1 n=1 Tax=Cinnamomum micranthum f. kanehirae TaxID=337451 RepID=A0A443P9J3_9MAGN|nr:peroxisomal acyl-coenzyme A oxidase 1 [Cinnamomum micranthum f. kanehirae]